MKRQTAVARRMPGLARDVYVADDQPTFWDRVEAGTWEPGTLAYLAASISDNTVFLDLGSWVGALTLYAAGLGATCIAVEADPAALDQLRRNLAANADLLARITVVAKAVASEAGSVRLGARRKPGDSMSSVLLADDGRTSWSAPAVTPGDLAAMLPGGLPTLVKIDIEGGEYALLPALGPLLARPATRFLVSFHPAILRAANPSGFAAMTRSALAVFDGYDSFAIEGTGAVGRPVAPAALEEVDTWAFEQR